MKVGTHNAVDEASVRLGRTLYGLKAARDALVESRKHASPSGHTREAASDASTEAPS